MPDNTIHRSQILTAIERQLSNVEAYRKNIEKNYHSKIWHKIHSDAKLETKSKIAELRSRRAELARQREYRDQRTQFGPKCIEHIRAVLGRNICTKDFDLAESGKDLLMRTDDYRTYKGQVAAYIDSSMSSTSFPSVASKFLIGFATVLSLESGNSSISSLFIESCAR
jgi:hypothetical protein